MAVLRVGTNQNRPPGLLILAGGHDDRKRDGNRADFWHTWQGLIEKTRAVQLRHNVADALGMPALHLNVVFIQCTGQPAPGV